MRHEMIGEKNRTRFEVKKKESEENWYYCFERKSSEDDELSQRNTERKRPDFRGR